MTSPPQQEMPAIHKLFVLVGGHYPGTPGREVASRTLVRDVAEKSILKLGARIFYEP